MYASRSNRFAFRYAPTRVVCVHALYVCDVIETDLPTFAESRATLIYIYSRL